MSGRGRKRKGTVNPPKSAQKKRKTVSTPRATAKNSNAESNSAPPTVQLAETNTNQHNAVTVTGGINVANMSRVRTRSQGNLAVTQGHAAPGGNQPTIRATPPREVTSGEQRQSRNHGKARKQHGDRVVVSESESSSSSSDSDSTSSDSSSSSDHRRRKRHHRRRRASVSSRESSKSAKARKRLSRRDRFSPRRSTKSPTRSKASSKQSKAKSGKSQGFSPVASVASSSTYIYKEQGIYFQNSKRGLQILDRGKWVACTPQNEDRIRKRDGIPAVDSQQQPAATGAQAGSINNQPTTTVNAEVVVNQPGNSGNSREQTPVNLQRLNAQDAQSVLAAAAHSTPVLPRNQRGLLPGPIPLDLPIEGEATEGKLPPLPAFISPGQPKGEVFSPIYAHVPAAIRKQVVNNQFVELHLLLEDNHKTAQQTPWGIFQDSKDGAVIRKTLTITEN